MGSSCPGTQRSDLDRHNLTIRAGADEHRSRHLVQYDHVGGDLRHSVEMERAREHWATNARVFRFDIGEDYREAVAHRLLTRPLPRQVRSANRIGCSVLPEKVREIGTGDKSILAASSAAFYRIRSFE